MAMTQQLQQAIPLQIHHTDKLIVLAAPMPGLEPQDISVVMMGNRVTIRGDYRGSRQDSGDLLLSEWTIGPYYREIDLPMPVNGPLTNASYGNGVLVLSMPKMQHDAPESYTALQLEVVEATRGQHVGHTGSDIRSTSTEEHRHRIEQAVQGQSTP